MSSHNVLKISLMTSKIKLPNTYSKPFGKRKNTAKEFFKNIEKQALKKATKFCTLAAIDWAVITK